MAAKFEDTRTYKQDKAVLISSVETALEKCNFLIKKVDVENGKIRAKSKINMMSLGEDIDIWVAENGVVRMKSECAFPTQIFDWGKNKKNVQRFFEAMEKA